MKRIITSIIAVTLMVSMLFDSLVGMSEEGLGGYIFRA